MIPVKRCPPFCYSFLLNFLPATHSQHFGHNSIGEFVTTHFSVQGITRHDSDDRDDDDNDDISTEVSPTEAYCVSIGYMSPCSSSTSDVILHVQVYIYFL
jgi:hypothetical protein